MEGRQNESLKASYLFAVTMRQEFNAGMERSKDTKPGQGNLPLP